MVHAAPCAPSTAQIAPLMFSFSLLFIHRRHHFGIGPKPFRGAHIITLLPVHPGNFIHLRIGQGEVKQVKIIPNVRRILRSGDDNVAILNMPAQDDLRAGLSVFPGQPGNRGS